MGRIWPYLAILTTYKTNGKEKHVETSSCAPEIIYCSWCFAIKGGTKKKKGEKQIYFLQNDEKFAKIVRMYKTDTFSPLKLFWLWTKADGLECCHNNYAVILLMTWLLCHMSLRNHSTTVLQSNQTRMMAKWEDDKIQQPWRKSPSRLMGPYGMLYVSASLRIITRATRCLTWCHLHLFHKDWEISWCCFCA